MTVQQTLGTILVVGVIGWIAYRTWEDRRRAERSLAWPMVRAEISSWDIAMQDQGEYSAIVLHLGFTYRVANRSYGGIYKERPGSRKDAEHMLRVYLDGPFLVRVNPSNPYDYFVDPYRDAREQTS